MKTRSALSPELKVLSVCTFSSFGGCGGGGVSVPPDRWSVTESVKSCQDKRIQVSISSTEKRKQGCA